MNDPSPQRWQKLWETIGGQGNPCLWYERLRQAYAESHRHYHTLRHVNECLALFDDVQLLTQQPLAVEMALWFHDAVFLGSIAVVCGQARPSSEALSGPPTSIPCRDSPPALRAASPPQSATINPCPVAPINQMGRDHFVGVAQEIIGVTCRLACRVWRRLYVPFDFRMDKGLLE